MRVINALFHIYTHPLLIIDSYHPKVYNLWNSKKPVIIKKNQFTNHSSVIKHGHENKEKRVSVGHAGSN